MEFLKRTWAEIDINSFIDNVNIAKKSCSGNVMAVVKANAYGCGADAISTVAKAQGIKWFGVSNLQEALDLRQAGVDSHILILGYTPPECAPILTKQNISQAVFSYDYAYQLMQYSKGKIKIHIKLDTGMSRIGFDFRTSEFNELNDVITVLSFDCFEFEGIFTHFSTSDCDTEFNKEQYELFVLGVDKIKQSGYSPIVTHCCNSAASVLQPSMHKDLCRLGIILYANEPSYENIYKDIVTVKSVITHIKKIQSGQGISYGRTFITDKEMTVATVSAGYADGFCRSLSNKAYVLINGKKAKVLGNICMDQFIVDVTDLENINVGDEVILFGGGISIAETAKIANTISYEIICGISKRVPRVYVYNQKKYSADEIINLF